MPTKSELAILCPHIVKVASKTGTDGHGQPSYGADKEYPALVDQKTRLFNTLQGQAISVVASVYFGEQTSPAITTEDRITLPDGSRPVIFSIDKAPDYDGTFLEIAQCTKS